MITQPRPTRRQRAAPFMEASAGELNDKLPDGCITYIFGFLPGTCDRHSCSAVCRRWFRLQASMVPSDFKLNRNHDQPSREVSWILNDPGVSDLSLGTKLIGLAQHKVLTELSVTRNSRLPLTRHQLTDMGIIVLTQVATRLKAITLRNCPMVGNEGLSHIANNCPRLQKLDLMHSPLVTDDGLMRLVTKCTNLSSLSLQGCPNICNISMLAIAEHSLQLTMFVLASCPRVQDTGIVTVITQRHELMEVVLASMPLSVAVCCAIEGHGRLSSVHLERVWGIPAACFCRLSSSPRLTHLKLVECHGFADIGFWQVGPYGLARVRHVAIKYCRSLTQAGLLQLTRSARLLETLHLDHFNDISHASLLGAIANCSGTIKTLILEHCHFYVGGPFGATGLVADQCPLLETIRMRRCTGLANDFFSWVGRACRSLRSVAFVEMESVTNQAMESLLCHLRGDNEIVSIDLSGCTKLGNRGLRAVMRECGPRLCVLLLNGCTGLGNSSIGVIGTWCPMLVELDLGRTAITNEGLRRIMDADMGDLAELTLAGCIRITDRALEDIEEAMVPSLERVNLEGCTRLTPSGRLWFSWPQW